MNKPSIIYFGTPEFSLTVLDSLLVNNYPVKGVVTAPDRPKGRSGIDTPTPVKVYAQEHNLPVFTPSTLKDNIQIKNQLRSLQPDLFVVFSYGKIIPDELLSIPSHGALNVHPSLLPKYRGPSPVQAQILAGETVTGVTIIQMTAEVDSGPIVAQNAMSMPANTTFHSLINTLSQFGADLLNDCIMDYRDNKIELDKQDENQATYTKIIKKEDGFISSEKLKQFDPITFDRMIRAYHPWPSVWTKFDNKVVKFLPNHMVQIEGKFPISVKQLLNGYPDLASVIKSVLEM